MKNIYIYCEGQTEESFVNEVLCPYLLNCDIYAQPIVCSTKRTHNKKYRGGAVSYEKIKHELQLICRTHKNETVTTMFDYYAMPSSTPEIECAEQDIYKRMDRIESAVTADIGEPNLFFNLLLHEFEGLLFSQPDTFSLIADKSIVNKIQQIRDSAVSPEHINNSPETAPSKRIIDLIPDYAKVKNGTLISKNTGIDILLSECKHFAAWVEKIKNI